MNTNFIITPFISVGSLLFGMNQDNIETLFDEKAKYLSTDYSGKLNLGWDNISLRINKNGFLDEISFFADGIYKPFIYDINIFEDPLFKQKIDILTTKSFDISGTEVYLSIGMSMTGFSDNDDRTITIFSKGMIPIWQNLYNN
jgi:hypothetical protein